MEDAMGRWRIRSHKEAIAVTDSPGSRLPSSARFAGTRPRFEDFVRSKDDEYRRARPLQTKNDVLEKKRALQASLLEELSRSSGASIKRIPKKERHFLFDAVVDGQAMMRVGRPADGGKWVCDPQALGDHAVVYSFGGGEDISFDTDMAGLFGCQVHLFDPNPMVAKSFPSQKSGYSCGAGRLFYHPIGLGPVSSEKGREWYLVIKGRSCVTKGLLDIARSLHHARIELLKIDIEGGEFSSLREMLATGALGVLNVKMILVEFHIWNSGLFVDFVHLVEALAKDDYWIYRKEFNPTNVKCAEYAFVKSSFLDAAVDPARPGHTS
jgi:hypothetical protein